MLRATNWITPLTLGMALVSAMPTQAAEGRKPSEPVAQAAHEPQAADYVVQLPADEEASAESDSSYPYTADDETAQPLDEPVAMEGEELDEATSTEEDAPATEEAEVIKERYPNGSIRIERETTQDAAGNYINHGSWKMWDERGNLQVQGQYEYGNRTGVWIRWYRSVTDANILGKAPYSQFPGPFISQAEFKNDLLDGLWTIYDGKTRKISQWSFEKGKRNGTSTWWFANGKKMREANFVSGDMQGEYFEWAPDGTVRVKEQYEEGRKIATKTAYHKDGKAKKTEGVYLFAKEVEHSPDDWWNCKLLTTVKSGKDEKHGPWTSWFPSGQMQLQGAYEHDLQVGKFTWWHSNGQRALEGTFDRGKQDGGWTWWHANGQKSIEGEYANGNPTGRWTWWHEDGRVVQSADLSHSEGVVIETPRHLEPLAVPVAPTPTPSKSPASTARRPAPRSNQMQRPAVR